MKDIIVVQGYYLAEFCQKIEPLIKDGWSFDFESNERYPTSFGSFYSATLVKDIQEEVTEVKTEEVKTEEEEVNQSTKSKPGRKPKAE